MTSQYINIIQIDEPIKKRGRPIGSTKLIKAIDDPQYFNRYYKEHLAQQINCTLCSALVSKAKMKRHQSRSVCAKKQQIILV
jgi:hypothetical protein